MKALLVHFRSCFRISLTLSVAAAAPPPPIFASAPYVCAEVLSPTFCTLRADVRGGSAASDDDSRMCLLACQCTDRANGQFSWRLLSVSHITDNIMADNCAFAVKNHQKRKKSTIYCACEAFWTIIGLIIALCGRDNVNVL